MKNFLSRRYFVFIGLTAAVVYWLLETMLHVYALHEGSLVTQLFPAHDANELWMRVVIAGLFMGFGFHAYAFTERKRHVEREHELLILKLQNSLAEIRELRGMLPICAHCKKIRDDKGYWEVLETYLFDHQQIDFTHSICPECAAKYYPDFVQAKIPT